MKWSKHIILGMGLLAFGLWANAQSIKDMLEQIGALKAFISTAEEGYKIAEDGLHTIRDIKNGEFVLHEVFFSSLKSVNPAVRTIPQVQEIIDLQTAIVKQLQDARNGYIRTGGLNAGDLDYVGKVFDNLISLGLADIDALEMLLNDGELQMEDGERIRHIEEIDERMRDRFVFVQAITREAALLSEQRQHEVAN